MKYYRNKLSIFILIPILCLTFTQALAQEEKPVKSRMSLNYHKVSGERILKSVIKARVGRKYKFLPKIPIEFNIIVDTGSVYLGSGHTNQNGEVSFIVSDELFHQYNLDGNTSFESSFIGSDKFKPSSSSVTIKDLKLNLSFAKEEDDKQIILTAFEYIENESLPLSENLEIVFYVPRTFTLFKIGSTFLKDGSAIIPFPIDLPGDTLGNMEVIAKIEDHDSFGNLEVSSSINWGLPQEKITIEKRGLGDTNAPLWMVYTLIVLLSLVWFHYFYVIYSIYLIKKESKKALIGDHNSQ